MVAVQLLDRKAAVQELAEQLRVSLAGASVEREVIHPLTLPTKKKKRKKERELNDKHSGGKTGMRSHLSSAVQLALCCHVSLVGIWILE